MRWAGRLSRTSRHRHDQAVTTVVVDLPNTSFIDVLGVGALIRAKNRAEAAYSVGANGRIVRVFEIAGIADFLAGPKTSKLVGLLRGHKASTLSLAERGQDSPPPAGGGPEASPIRDCKAVPRGQQPTVGRRSNGQLGSPARTQKEAADSWSRRQHPDRLPYTSAARLGSAPSLPLSWRRAPRSYRIDARRARGTANL